MDHQYPKDRNTPTLARGGLTMIEVLISTALVGLLTIGALATVGAVGKTRAIVSERLMAQDLAQHMMSEILEKAYADVSDVEAPLGRDAGESITPRSNYDDVDDFDGWDATPPVNPNGSPITDYTGWRREAFVSWVRPGSLVQSDIDKGLKRIRVRVTSPYGFVHELHSLRTTLGAGEQTPLIDANQIAWIEGRLKIGSETPTTVGGTNLVNAAEDE